MGYASSHIPCGSVTPSVHLSEPASQVASRSPISSTARRSNQYLPTPRSAVLSKWLLTDAGTHRSVLHPDCLPSSSLDNDSILIDFVHDDTATLPPSSGGTRPSTSPSGKVSSTKGSTTITSSTVDTPRFKRLPTAFSTDDLKMLHTDTIEALSSNADEEALEKMRKS
jgi:hypothetical protein